MSRTPGSLCSESQWTELSKQQRFVWDVRILVVLGSQVHNPLGVTSLARLVKGGNQMNRLLKLAAAALALSTALALPTSADPQGPPPPPPPPVAAPPGPPAPPPGPPGPPGPVPIPPPAQDPVTVPEPATITLLAIGLGAVALGRRKKATENR